MRNAEEGEEGWQRRVEEGRRFLGRRHRLGKGRATSGQGKENLKKKGSNTVERENTQKIRKTQMCFPPGIHTQKKTSGLIFWTAGKIFRNQRERSLPPAAEINAWTRGTMSERFPVHFRGRFKQRGQSRPTARSKFVSATVSASVRVEYGRCGSSHITCG